MSVMEAASEHHYEYGYRTEQTGDVWPEEHGGDGSWTPAQRELGIPAIDVYDDGQEPAAIRNALARAGVTGQVIRRQVTITRGPAEIVGDTPKITPVH